MASEIQVYKAAATAVGSSAQIASPNDDRPVARAIKAVWDMQRRAALREAAWNFAIARAELPALTSIPAFGFTSAYQTPADFLRLIEIHGFARSDYQIEGRRILTNTTGPLQLRYIRDMPEPADWDDEFAEAFALRIAWRIGPKIAGSAFSQDQAWRAYREALAQAKTTDATENPPFDQEESDWVLARHAGSFYDPQHPFQTMGS